MTVQDSNTLSRAAWTMLILLGLLWGGSFFLAHIAVVYVPPLTLVLLRVVLAAIALHVWLRGKHGLYRHLRENWRAFAVMGLFNNAIPFGLIFLGQTVIGAGLASILNATTPLWSVIVAHLLTSDEKMSPMRFFACFVGLAGVAVMIGPDALRAATGAVWPQLAIIGAAMSYGFAATYGKRFKGLPAQVTATGQLTASSIIVLPVALAVDRPWTLDMPPTEIVLTILGLAWASTAFAYFLYFRIIQTAGAVNASLVTLLVPASAILLGTVFLGERLTPLDIAGMVLIGVALTMFNSRALAPLLRTFRR